MITGNAFLDPVLRPLLSLPPIFSIMLISLFISLIITVVYKLVTDQKKMKEFKDDIKASQKELKKHKDNPKKMMEIQKKAMEKNMQYMKHSLKPTLFTMLPILLIFGWLNANMAYYPLEPNQEFQVTAELDYDYSGNVTLRSFPELDINKVMYDEVNHKFIWKLRGEAGEYLIEFESDNGELYQKNIIITHERRYTQPEEVIRDSFIKRLEISNDPVVYLRLGNWTIGWFGTYIIFSLVFSTLLRKLFKVY